MYTGKYFIEKLGMNDLPEGGHFVRAITSAETDTNGKKKYTSIYFVLKDREESLFHRLKSDEIWYFQAGTSLVMYIIDKEGNMRQEKLGLDVERGEMPQVLVKNGEIFGAVMDGTGFSLIGCMVTPGYEDEDFELLDRADLLAQYPQYESVIKKLTK